MPDAAGNSWTAGPGGKPLPKVNGEAEGTSQLLPEAQKSVPVNSGGVTSGVLSLVGEEEENTYFTLSPHRIHMSEKQ